MIAMPAASDTGARVACPPLRTGWLICVCLAAAAASWGGALPPAPQADLGPQLPTTLFLELVVNGLPARQAVPVRQAGNDWWVRLSDLSDVGVRRDRVHCGDRSQWLALNQCPEIDRRYDSNALRLELSVPPSWLQEQRLSGRATRDAPPASSSAGVLLNYDIYASRSADGRDTAALWSEQRVFANAGTFATTGVYRSVSLPNGTAEQLHGTEGYRRYDSHWTSSDETRLLTWTVGDLVTGAQSWSTPVRLGGIQLARDFRLRPDLITYPLPQFSGQAAVPSTVDLFVNGYRAATQRVQPGPFTITDIPFVNGAGEATILTTDALGRQVAATVPFYASSELLQEGLADYSLSIGALRRDYGYRDFSYGRAALSGSMRYGVHDSLTLESHLDLTSARSGAGYALTGVGGVLKLRLAGVVNASASHSTFRDQPGWQYTFGYRYTFRGFNVGYQGMRSDASFLTLDALDAAGLRSTRRSDVVNASLSTSAMGSLSAGYFDMHSNDGTRVQLLNLSYSRPLRSRVSFHMSANRDIERSRTTVLAQIIATFGTGGSLTIGSQHSKNAGEYLEYTRSVPSEGGFGWNLGYARPDDNDSTRNASLAWSNARTRMEAGVYGTADQRVRWASTRGALVAMDSEVFAARQISDAFVVVTTDGVADVAVRHENQLVGRTDRNGYLLVPWVSSNYAAKYAIDPLELPADLRIPVVEQRMTVRRHSGALLHFSIQPVVAITVALTDGSGLPIPVGSLATASGSGQQAVVGFDGLVYFEDLAAETELAVTLPDGGECHAHLTLTDAASQPLQLGPLPCEQH